MKSQVSWKDLKANLDIQEAADALRRRTRYDELKRTLCQAINRQSAPKTVSDSEKRGKRRIIR